MFLPWKLFRESSNMHIKAFFKVREALAIFTKFQIIIPEEDLKIFIFIMHY